MTTDVLLVLDRSGSMDHLAEELRGGINSYLDNLRKDEDNTYRVTIILFDGVNRQEVLCSFADLDDVPKLTEANYYARGITPLYDALGQAIRSHVGGDKVICVTFTDGLENASREDTQESVNALVKEKEAAGWAFEYLGAGSESWDKRNTGIYAGTQAASNVRTGLATGQSIGAMTASMAETTVAYAATGEQTLLSEEERNKIWGDEESDS